MKKKELFDKYADAKKSDELSCVILYIHMPTGEEETIVNPNVEQKMEYINKTYNEDLVHNNCPEIYITEAMFATEYEPNMKFGEALDKMKAGAKVKLPSWSGYWYWNPDKETVMIHTKEGEELDIRETDRVSYTLENILSDEWQIADENNCPQLGGEATTFSFSFAIKYLRRGFKVARKGWNGKKQYIQLATGIFYKTADGDIVNCEHDAIGNMAIAFCGTSGVQMGWLASQEDMLADDWMFVDEENNDSSKY